MSPAVLEKILILQERDARRAGFEAQLQAIPREIAAIEQKIAGERAAIERAREEVRQLEVRRKALETEISAAEEQVIRYKGQQMQVKKNEEYQALSHEIETTQQVAGALEEEEIKVLFSIDAAKTVAGAAEAQLNAAISGYERRIAEMKEREGNLRVELKSAGEQVEAARSGVEEGALRIYDRLARAVGLPLCVPLVDQKCGGCHLKVSSAVLQEAHRGEKITPCDNCGRIVYLPS